MKRNQNSPGAAPDDSLYDKHEAVAFLKAHGVDVGISTLFYHNYVSKQLEPGQKRYGRLTWTGTQLSNFLAKHPKAGFKQRSALPTMTLAEWVATGQHEAVNRGEAAYYKGVLVSRVERDLNHTRRYYIHLSDPAKTEVPAWNNTRLTLRPIPNDSEG